MVNLPRDDEFAELGQFFNAMSARLSADRSQAPLEPASGDGDGRADNAGTMDTGEALKKLVAVTRLSAGIGHELKNPLNAAVIHLELLKQQLASQSGNSAAADHVAVIAAQMRRLDEVVQGFLRFIRPENLRLEAVPVMSLVEQIMPIVKAEAEPRRRG